MTMLPSSERSAVRTPEADRGARPSSQPPRRAGGWFRWAALAAGFLLGQGALGSAEPPLPDDTLAVLCLPNLAQAVSGARQSPALGAWLDPALGPFRERITRHWDTRVITPLASRVGATPADLASLFGGQFTLALLRNGWPQATNARPMWLLVAEAPQPADHARILLKELAVRRLNQGQPVRTQTLREAEFHGFPVTARDLDPAWFAAVLLGQPSPEPATNSAAPARPAKPPRTVLWAGQYQSWVVAAEDTNVIDAVLSRLVQGGDRPHFAHQRVGSAQGSLPSDTMVHGWLDLGPFVDLVVRLADEADRSEVVAPAPFPMPKRTALLRATGLTALRSASFAVRESGEGSIVEIAVEVPAGERRGLLRALELDARDASPPPLVPANAVRFQRLRLDLRKSWHALETMFTDVFPQAAGVLRLLFETAGQGAERVDLRQEMLASLGDDLVRYELPPPTNAGPETVSGPTAVLLGSTNAAHLADTVKAMAVLLPPNLLEISDATNAGHKVTTLRVGAAPTNSPSAAPTDLWRLSANANLAVLANDEDLLRACLSTNLPASPLRDHPALAVAAQRIGGTSLGYLGYENLRETARRRFEQWRSDTNVLASLLAGTPLEPPPGTLPSGWQTWLDFRLLPPFDQVAQHFGVAISAAGADTNGFFWRAHFPRQPSAPGTTPANP